MMRAGSTAPMMNMNFYHNTDKIDQGSKTACASFVAKFISDELFAYSGVFFIFFVFVRCYVYQMLPVSMFNATFNNISVIS
jgi:hypothetical protein